MTKRREGIDDLEHTFSGSGSIPRPMPQNRRYSVTVTLAPNIIVGWRRQK